MSTMYNQEYPQERAVNLNVYPSYPSYPSYPPAPVPVIPTTVVVSNTVVNYGRDPQNNIMCPYCRANIRTMVESKATNKTHITALLLCCFCCWPCVCLPYCINSCQSSHHYCPSCNAFLGSYNG